MKDEIKEIIKFQDILNYYKAKQIEPTYCEELITTGELQHLLEYITNLQEKYKKSCETYQQALDETMSEKMDLQEELDRCVKANIILDNENTELANNYVLTEYVDEMTKLKDENKRLKEKLEDETLNKEIAQGHRKQVQDIELQERKELKDYKSRCEKVIEFCDYLLKNDVIIINKKQYYKTSGDDVISEHIKNILGGDDNE